MEYEGIIPALKGVASVLGGAIVTILGGWDSLFTLFCLFIILDFIIGIACAFKRGNFRSSVMRWGAFNKLIEVFIIAIFYYCDTIFGTNCLRNGALCWFLICEGSSIVENCIILGVQLPDGMGKILKQLKKTVSVNFTDIARRIIEDKQEQSEEPKQMVNKYKNTKK